MIITNNSIFPDWTIDALSYLHPSESRDNVIKNEFAQLLGAESFASIARPSKFSVNSPITRLNDDKLRIRLFDKGTARVVNVEVGQKRISAPFAITSNSSFHFSKSELMEVFKGNNKNYYLLSNSEYLARKILGRLYEVCLRIFNYFITKKRSESLEPITPTAPSDPSNKISRVFWIAMGCWGVYNLVDYGLSNFLALETLRHGTGPVGFIGIHLNGADPYYGGGRFGSSAGAESVKYMRDSQNFFHVFKDTEFLGNDSIDGSVIFIPIIKLLLPRIHAALSGVAHFPIPVLGAVGGLLVPTLKFRVIPEEVLNCRDNCRFMNDDDYSNLAYKTAQPMGIEYLGIRGSLSQGINSGTVTRMIANPEKVLFGMGLLGLAALVAKKTYNYSKVEQSEKSTPSSTKKEDTKEIYLAIACIFLNTL